MLIIIGLINRTSGPSLDLALPNLSLQLILLELLSLDFFDGGQFDQVGEVIAGQIAEAPSVVGSEAPAPICKLGQPLEVFEGDETLGPVGLAKDFGLQLVLPFLLLFPLQPCLPLCLPHFESLLHMLDLFGVTPVELQQNDTHLLPVFSVADPQPPDLVPREELLLVVLCPAPSLLPLLLIQASPLPHIATAQLALGLSLLRNAQSCVSQKVPRSVISRAS